MARDILAEPGTYVAIVADYSPDELTPDDIPDDYPVRAYVAHEASPVTTATCGECGLSWDDGIATSMTPAPAARCPFETFHPSDDTTDGWAVARLIP
jgi:hypothetical protein